MKKIPLIALALLLATSLSACLTPPPAADGADTVGEAVTLPPIELPDLTDDRTFTDLTLYKEQLSGAFAETQPTPAEEFTYEMSEEGVTITGYTGGAVVLLIPDTIEDRPVVAIGEKAFENKATLRAVSIPDSVRAIGIGAFAGCKSLATLRTPVFTCLTAPYFGALFGATSHEANGSAVPGSLSTLLLTAGETIPDYAFYACRGLVNVSLPEELAQIGSFAFYGCQSLAHVTTGNTSLSAVGRNAFANCAALLTLEMPATVGVMGCGMLEGCGKLEALTLPFAGGYRYGYQPTKAEAEAIEAGDMVDPAKTTYLGYLFGATDYTFTAGYLPASLITVTLLEGGGDVSPNAFFECASLREVILPADVTAIGRRAFYGCVSLSGMTLPDGVKSIGDDAFHGCIRLVEIHVGARLESLGVQAFMDCVSLSEVTLPAGVTHLPNAAFSGCASLETLTAEGVTSVGKKVFHRCDKLTGWSEGGIPGVPGKPDTPDTIDSAA